MFKISLKQALAAVFIISNVGFGRSAAMFAMQANPISKAMIQTDIKMRNEQYALGASAQQNLGMFATLIEALKKSLNTTQGVHDAKGIIDEHKQTFFSAYKLTHLSPTVYGQAIAETIGLGAKELAHQAEKDIQACIDNKLWTRLRETFEEVATILKYTAQDLSHNIVNKTKPNAYQDLLNKLARRIELLTQEITSYFNKNNTTVIPLGESLQLTIPFHITTDATQQYKFASLMPQVCKCLQKMLINTFMVGQGNHKYAYITNQFLCKITPSLVTILETIHSLRVTGFGSDFQKTMYRILKKISLTQLEKNNFKSALHLVTRAHRIDAIDLKGSLKLQNCILEKQLTILEQHVQNAFDQLLHASDITVLDTLRKQITNQELAKCLNINEGIAARIKDLEAKINTLIKRIEVNAITEIERTETTYKNAESSYESAQATQLSRSYATLQGACTLRGLTVTIPDIDQSVMARQLDTFKAQLIDVNNQYQNIPKRATYQKVQLLLDLTLSLRGKVLLKAALADAPENMINDIKELLNRFTSNVENDIKADTEECMALVALAKQRNKAVEPAIAAECKSLQLLAQWHKAFIAECTNIGIVPA